MHGPRKNRGRPPNLTSLTKIISGGQTGADFGALLVAESLGIPTGGVAPRGYRTETGPNLKLQTLGLTEHESDNYRARTIINIRDSDGTVIFGDICSPGSRLTLQACQQLGKPWIHFPLGFQRVVNPSAQQKDFSSERLSFQLWLQKSGIRVLNVAGNRESVSPGIQAAVQRFLGASLEHIFSTNIEEVALSGCQLRQTVPSQTEGNSTSVPLIEPDREDEEDPHR